MMLQAFNFSKLNLLAMVYAKAEELARNTISKHVK